MTKHKENKINHLIYLFLIKELGTVNKGFRDSLVQIYRFIRFNTDWKLDKNLVSDGNLAILDAEEKRILDCLKFYQLIDKNEKLTPYGEEFLQKEILTNKQLNKVFLHFKNNLSGKIAYEETCLLPYSPTAANCALCKDIRCENNKNIFKDLITNFIRIPNYNKSFSKT
ncbi:hypothetical protein MZM54_04510 [[Brevibacterium] frigoritolerans]|nr:hypothetical protein [Peribacillus frigoritolerans]